MVSFKKKGQGEMLIDSTLYNCKTCTEQKRNISPVLKKLIALNTTEEVPYPPPKKKFIQIKELLQKSL